MANWLDRLGVLLLDASLSATALLSLVALIMIGCRQPVRRICLARAAFLSVLVLIPLVIFAPFPRVALRKVACKAGLLAHPIFSYHYHQPLEPKPVLSDLTVGSATTAEQPPPVRELVRPIPRWLVLGYLAGTATALSWLLLGYWGLSWLTSRSEAVSPLAAELYLTLPIQGRRRRPRLRLSQRVRRPVLVGLFRQTILIPVDLDLPGSVDKLRLSLLHELAHAERMDSWFGLVSSLAQSFWYFLPPLWWIRAQMRLDQEFMADRRAAQTFGPLQTYASSLVKIASGDPELRPGAASPKPTSQGGDSPLFLRVLMLVRCPFQVESRPPRWWTCALPSLLLLGTMAASTLTLRVSEVPSPANPPPTSPTSTHPNPNQTFRMSRLVVNRPADQRGLPQTYALPVRLPRSFDLRFEVWGDPVSLAETKVSGLRLFEPQAGQHPQAPTPPKSWHHVRIRREFDQISVQLDQIPLPKAQGQKVTPSLSFETPANSPAHFRNLLLTW